jgi:hypothetical protein
MDVRQIVYTMAVNGKMRMAQEASILLDSADVKSEKDLKVLAESMGVDVSDDMSPYMIIEEMVAKEQYAKFS